MTIVPFYAPTPRRRKGIFLFYLSIGNLKVLLIYLLHKLKEINIPYIGNFSRQEILAKMTLGSWVNFSLSPIFAISMTLKEEVKYGLFFALSIFGNFREVANSAKIKPTRKIPDIWSDQQVQIPSQKGA